MILTLSEATALFHYDDSTGTIHLRQPGGWKRTPAGVKRGSAGVRSVQIGKEWCRVVAIVWLLKKGEWIGGAHLDYLDGNPDNTRIENLIRRKGHVASRGAAALSRSAVTVQAIRDVHTIDLELHQLRQQVEAITARLDELQLQQGQIRTTQRQLLNPATAATAAVAHQALQEPAEDDGDATPLPGWLSYSSNAPETDTAATTPVAGSKAAYEAELHNLKLLIVASKNDKMTDVAWDRLIQKRQFLIDKIASFD